MAHKSDRLFETTQAQDPEVAYSGDGPNQYLAEFVKEHKASRRIDEDEYSVPPFAEAIETSKRTAIYNMHSYHQGKKPHDAVRQYIRHYTNPGDLVLDPFCGSGSTSLASLIEGRKAIAIDRSPAATFITYNHCAPVTEAEIAKVAAHLESVTRTEMKWLYGTKCHLCEGEGTVTYTLLSHRYECTRCLNKVPLADCPKREAFTAKGKPKKIKACPYCLENGIVEEISTRGEKLSAVPVEIGYSCSNGCDSGETTRRHNDECTRRRQFFLEYDIRRVEEIAAADIPHPYPTTFMMNVQDASAPWGAEWRPGRNFRSVDALFSKRNLWALAAYFDAARRMENRRHSDLGKFALTAILLAMSRMQGYVEDPRFPNQLMRGTYYLPPISREYNVSQWLAGKWSNLKRGFSSINSMLEEGRFLASTQSAAHLSQFQDNSVDYIFTDPPYGDNVQYGELNFIWEAWLGLDTNWHNDEIIINSVRGVSEEDWAASMLSAMKECFRVLRPGRWISVCYHDTSTGTWELVQDLMAEAGFVAETCDAALYIDTEQKSYNQRTADKVNKRDLVINFRKPRPGETTSLLEITGTEDDKTFNEKVYGIIRGYLDVHPGASKDRVYDEVISRMVCAGELESHNFEKLLCHVADEVCEPDSGPSADGRRKQDPGNVSRWYVKESELEVADAAESAKEDAAAESIRTHIKKALENDPALDGIHYSNLFEHFVYTTRDKPRRPLAEWLLDYFYKTDSGTYRLPINDEEERLKAEGRAKGTNRRVKRFLALLDQAVAIVERDRPGDATLAEWIRHCKRSGLYEQGKLLYEKGGLNLDNLPEEAMVNAEEDYQVCVRQLRRQSE